MRGKIGVASLLYSRDYVPGVCTLGYQLRDLMAGSKCDDLQLTRVLVVEETLYTDTLEENCKQILHNLFEDIVLAPCLAGRRGHSAVLANNKDNLRLLGRPELAYTFSKILLWSLTQYDQILYLDADTLPLTAGFFDIFQYTNDLSTFSIAAAPDVGWPDMFNSGVLVLKPSKEVYNKLCDFVFEHVSIDGADQGILNQYFNQAFGSNGGRSWLRLPFLYNMTIPNRGYQYSPAVNYFKQKVELVHFIGGEKPWRQENTNDYFTNLWHNIYWQFQADFVVPQHLQTECKLTAASNFVEKVKSKDARIDSPENASDKVIYGKELEPQHLVAPLPREELANDPIFEWETEQYQDQVERTFETAPPAPQPIFDWETPEYYSQVERVFH